MPVELAIVAIVSIIGGVTALITITKIIVNHLERRRGAASASGSLTQTELRQLITEAVADATGPLENEIVQLQRRLGAGGSPALPPGPGAADDENLDRR